MSSNVSAKKKLAQHLLEGILEKIQELNEQIGGLEESRNSESKSTAGDKHEVGRAMMQTELDNLSKRLAELKERANSLKNLSLEKSTEVQNGSLIETTSGVYFMALGLGKVEMEGETYFVTSPVSPVGQALLGKKTGETVQFRNQKITITNLS
jgi:transcription elongation GreA/GreB family factor